MRALNSQRMLPFTDIASVEQVTDGGFFATRKIQIMTNETTEFLICSGVGSHALASELLDELHRFARLG
jgi:hypothetical protein